LKGLEVKDESKGRRKEEGYGLTQGMIEKVLIL
jgi:hypothetical protein